MNSAPADAGLNGSGSRSIVHALVALGLEEHDAWRCVHMMQGRTSIVLLEMYGAEDEDPTPRDAPPQVDLESIADADGRGAVWSCHGTGRWRYLRRVDWRIDDIDELREEIGRFAALQGRIG